MTAGQFTVWTRSIDDENSWEQELSTDDLETAHACAVEVGVGDVAATIWERGRFEVGGRRHTDLVLFWWTENYEAYMGGAPEGRGAGWPEHYEGPVTYQPVAGSALTTASPRATASAVPARRYKMVHCAACGLEMPQNEAHSYTHDVKVGSTSGSSRHGSSWTSRVSSRSFSNSSTHRQSYSSGRTHYRTKTDWLCGDCHVAQLEADKSPSQVIGRVIRWLLS